jgi:hypothetical protein
MSYQKFTLKHLEDDFGIRVEYAQTLLGTVPMIQPSALLQAQMEQAAEVPMVSEKARSEAIIAPILYELRRIAAKQVNIFSGYNLKVDAKRGLTGYCDFIIAETHLRTELRSPLFCMVEAKKEEIETGLGQCASEMLAARIFNEKDGSDVRIIYGSVTSAYDWLFLRLDGDTLTIDTRRYALANLPELLGALQTVIDVYKP